MKVAILAGGLGTRISEESHLKPKPMIEIGGYPILWHLMKYYSHFGHNEFVILLGYKSYVVKEYFANYFLHRSDITIDTSRNEMKVHQNYSEDWKITMIDTGLKTMTGGRIKRAEEHLKDDTFLLTYGDGLSNININELVDFHKSKGKALTLSSVRPEGRFGALDIQEDGSVSKFIEKPKGDGSWINGGFFVCEPSIFDYIKSDDHTVFEQEPLMNMATDGQLSAYKFDGFWKCMDTMRDHSQFNDIWESGNAPWKVWKENILRQR